MSTLVLHPGALGDVLLAVPALRALRRQARGERLVLAAQPRIGALLTALGIVDAGRDFESLGLGPLFVEDAPLPTLGAFAEAKHVICWFGARDPTFVRRLRQIAPGAQVAWPGSEGTLPVWRHLCASVGAGGDVDCEPVAVPATLEAAGQRALADAGWDGRARLVMVHAGAGGLAKRWPLEGFASVLTRWCSAGITIAVTEGPAERGTAERLSARLAGPVIVLRELPLAQLAGAIRAASVWIGNDSGVSHLAAAVGAPALVLFQAANQAWMPWSPTARVVIVRAGAVVEADLAAVSAGLHGLLG